MRKRTRQVIPARLGATRHGWLMTRDNLEHVLGWASGSGASAFRLRFDSRIKVPDFKVHKQPGFLRWKWNRFFHGKDTVVQPGVYSTSEGNGEGVQRWTSGWADARKWATVRARGPRVGPSGCGLACWSTAATGAPSRPLTA